MFLTVTGSLAVSTGRSLFSGILRMGFHDRYEQCYRKRTWFAYFEGRFIPRKEERRFVRELGQQLSSFGTRNPFQKPEVGRMRRASVLCCALQRAFTQGTTERAVSTAWRGSSEASTSGASYALKQRYGWVQHGSWVWLLSGHGALDYAQCNRFQVSCFDWAS